MFTRIARAQSFGPPPPFDPSQIANLAGWFKGSDFDATTDGTEIALWNDHSGLANNTTAIAGAGDRPTVARNSINTSMTAVNDANHSGLDSVAYSISNKDIWSIFAVIKFSAGDGPFFSLDDGNANGMRMGLAGGSGIFHLVYPNVADFPTNESVSYNAWHVVIAESNGANTATIYVDGTALTWPTQPTSLNNNPAKFRLLEGNVNFNGFLAELAFYNGALSSGNRTSLASYASSRFGV